jgi:tight adherence protein B
VVTTLVIALLGLGIAAGLCGLFRVLYLPQKPDHRAARHSRRPTVKRVADDVATWNRFRRVGVPVLFGLLCVVITRWPVAGVLGALAVAALPTSLRKVPPGEGSKKTEAVATWTESIRDSLAASAGLAQAIEVTAPSAPTPIRPPARALAKRLTNGVPLEDALRLFAHDVEDPAAEFLVCALLLAATSQAQRLVEVLSALAESIREDVSMHLRIDASRASARSSVRTVVIFTVAFAFTLMVIAHPYLSPFGTPTGQLVLACVGLFYAVGLMLMVRLVRSPPEARLLDPERVG